MIYRLTPPMRSVAALGLALALIGGLALLAVLPSAARMSSVSREILAEREALGRLLRMAAERRDARAASASAPDVEARVVFFPGDTEAIQLAALQTAFRAIARSSDVRLQSMRTLTPTAVGEVPLAGLQATLQARVGGLQALLHAIEVHKPWLMVEELAASPVPPAQGNERLLQIDIRVSAFLAGERREKSP